MGGRSAGGRCFPGVAAVLFALLSACAGGGGTRLDAGATDPGAEAGGDVACDCAVDEGVAVAGDVPSVDPGGEADAFPDAGTPDAGGPDAGTPDVADAGADPSSETWSDAAIEPDAAPDVPSGPDVAVGSDAPDWGPWSADVGEHAFEATGFYHVDLHPDRWWLVTPDGQPFYSIGINHAQPNGEADQKTGKKPYGEAVDALYADHAAWADAAAARLDSWGFNTIGAWSDLGLFASRMPYTVILGMSGADWQTGKVEDYFDPAFEQRCADIAAAHVAPRKDDPNLVGYFLDNEMHWAPDWRTPNTLLEDFLALPEDAPGRLVAEQHAGDPSGFLLLAASRYFEVASKAVRAADPNHLILGSRFVSVMTPPELPAAAGPWVDVLGVNYYFYIEGLVEALQQTYAPLVPVDGWLRAFTELSGRPVMVTEFSFRAADAGVPNSWPPVYPTLATQDERAAAFAAYAGACQSSPWIVGHHWFQYFDEPPGGRFDGEDSNFGLVDNADQPWATLTDRMAIVHAAAPHVPTGPL